MKSRQRWKVLRPLSWGGFIEQRQERREHLSTHHAAIFELTRGLETPVLAVDPALIAHSVHSVRSALPGVDLWYALKCNPHRVIIETVHELGVGFEVASEEEVRTLRAMGVDGARMMCLHPIKSPAFLRLLRECNVRVLAADCVEEIQKILEHAPEGELVLRVDVQAPGSRVPLDGKFGCEPDTVVALAHHARRMGLNIVGLTMHPGSQCESAHGWASAIERVKRVADDLRADGFIIELVSLGGGLPAPYSQSIPQPDQFGEAFVQTRIREAVGPAGRITIEPGRALVASSGTLVATVVGTATRSGVPWLYLDAGIFHGLFELLPAAGSLPLTLISQRTQGPRVQYRIGGPTCDSMDVLPGLYELPRLEVGDRVAFLNAGAYSTSLCTSFNGFAMVQTARMVSTAQEVARV